MSSVEQLGKQLADHLYKKDDIEGLVLLQQLLSIMSKETDVILASVKDIKKSLQDFVNRPIA